MRKLSRFGRFASNSTFPGIKFAYQSQTRFGTIFWSTTTLVGFAVGCYVCFGVLSAFSESPTYTIISQEPSISLRFPSITFCLLFRTTMNRLALLNITKTEDIEYLTHSFFTFTSPSYFDLDRSEAIINSSLTSNKSESQLHQLLEKYSMAELITNYLTPSCADIAFLCALGPNSRPVSCCSQPHEIFVASNGPCYSFDIINNYTQKVRSTMGKAMVVMNLPPLANLSNSTFYNYDSSGIQIFSTKEAASVEDNPIFVNRGSNSVVSLTLNKRIRLSSDQNPCQEKKVRSPLIVSESFFFQ